VKDLDSSKRKQEMEKIQQMFQKAKAYGDDKVSITFLFQLDLIQSFVLIV